MHTNTHAYRRPQRSNFKQPGERRPVACAPGLKWPHTSRLVCGGTSFHHRQSGINTDLYGVNMELRSLLR